MENLYNLSDIGVISIFDFFLGLFELLIICSSFKIIYEKFSLSVSNRKIFSNNFIPFSVSIFLIVFTIKSSLVLSLGLVGALSIIRFRTAIKETEQIVALLILTGISISIAAHQLLIPIIISITIFVYYYSMSKIKSNNDKEKSVMVSTIFNFNERAYEKIISDLSKDFNLNISILTLTQKDKKCDIVISLSEISLEKIENYKNSISNSDMELKELKVY